MSNPLPPPAFNAPPTPGMPLTPSPCTHDSMARGRPIPVTLTEAGLDSPTFRACAAYYADQIEAVERWLESATKSASKLTQEILSLEDTINLYLNKLTPPMAIADNMLDQDYTLLALKRVSDASREWWMQVLSMMRKMNATMVDPVRQYINGDLRAFKEARRTLDTTQRTFDQALARYASQNKTKEPSFLREEAFAVHETRKAYLKACMDFCVLGPQARASLDKLMVRQCFELAREVKLSRDIAHNSLPWTEDLDRIRGWSKEMEAAEPSFRRELASIRREISDAAILAYQPSRELEAYSASTVPFLGSRGPVSSLQTAVKTPAGSPGGLSGVLERQGWLFLKSVSGKPARTQWVRRWFYCRNGVFGSLQHNAQGVFQDDEVGVLLCSAKPAISEERRFCFEVKTKISALVLQAETQQQLSEWLHVFEAAKKQALETSTSKEFIPMRTGSDPAFSIKPPSAPEFSTRNIDAATATALALDDSALAVPSLEPALSSRASIDLYGNQAPRRSFTAAIGRDSDDNHTHSGNRIMSRRDLHRKATLYNMDPPQSAGHGPVGGIAGLTSISTPSSSKGFVAAAAAAAMGQIDMPPGSLAPLTPPRPPLGTNMTRAAIQAATDRSVAMGTPYQLPAFLLANFWGSNAWSSFYANGQLDYKKEEERTLALAASEGKNVTAAYPPPGASHRKTMSADMIQPTLMSEKLDLQTATPKQPQYPIVPKSHSQEVFPPKYPPELKAQHASFRLLFPSVPMSEKLVLVFRGAWSSTRGSGPDSDAGDTKLTATGRVFVTPDSLHFYGTRMGLLVAFSLSLDWVSEITAAPGKDCDYLFLHLTGAGNCQSQSNDVANDGKQKTKSPSDIGLSRITIKTFLENLPLLQARLNVLMDNLQAEEPMDIQDITATFIDMERGHDSRIPDSPGGSVSVGSWEEIEQPPIAPITLSLPPAAAARTEKQIMELQSQKAHAPPPVSPGLPRMAMGARRSTGLSTGGRTRGNTGGRLLPRGPSGYEPDDMKTKVCERHFEIGAKACFHVVFGDRSYIFARFYNERQATNIEQRPWALSEEGGRMRREFRYRADTADMLGRTRPENITDYQTIDMFADHATYVVSHINTAWHLPFSSHFRVVTKMVITHEAKSRCKMAFYTRVDWGSTAPPLGKRMVDKQATNDATAVIDALADAITDQVHKLGAHSRTKKAIQVYGHIGGTTQTVVYAGDGGGGDVTVALAKGGMGAGNGGESATGTQLSSGSKSKDSNGSANSGGGIRINGISSSRAATLRRHTLTQMAFDTLFSFAESIATSVLMSVFAVIRSLFRLISAHRVLLGLLVASAMFNVLMTSKDASTWWTERRAARFMQRVGVGPNVVMSRAVRWEDLSAAVGSSEPLWNTGSECYAAFQAITNSTDPDAHLDSPASIGSPSSFLSTPHSYETARRMHRTRQRLGSYRHDLLVAMRVINKIEREMEVAEWESWVSDENQRCAQLRYALDVSVPAVPKSNEGGSETETDTETQEGRGGTHGADKLAERRKALFHWYKDYCGSCRADALKLAHGQEQQQQPNEG
ncbi:putative PH domain-containing protein C19A8.02 [Ceratocystis fimbriata CBS 114723]|uniref:Putative PH domain-containing protein C19A8.02 n=1 Tax=Ceratocystis fimbriata CBS 114723 TaxID=1035309 RepID=A0A2C5X505_9PEZI|nr:putative PH domain-containing protein C19A8.02 [Ceratocystis fimbriata CBS 114723]